MLLFVYIPLYITLHYTIQFYIHYNHLNLTLKTCLGLFKGIYMLLNVSVFPDSPRVEGVFNEGRKSIMA